jgi:hypothetical protein
VVASSKPEVVVQHQLQRAGAAARDVWEPPVSPTLGAAMQKELDEGTVWKATLHGSKHTGG